MIRPQSDPGFRRYLRCELETLSDRSLELYAAEMEEAQKAGLNPVLQKHQWLEEHLNRQPSPKKDT